MIAKEFSLSNIMDRYVMRVHDSQRRRLISETEQSREREQKPWDEGSIICLRSIMKWCSQKFVCITKEKSLTNDSSPFMIVFWKGQSNSVIYIFNLRPLILQQQRKSKKRPEQKRNLVERINVSTVPPYTRDIEAKRYSRKPWLRLPPQHIKELEVRSHATL